MSAGTILIIYAAFTLAELVWEELLTVLNMRTVIRNRGAVPPAFMDAVPEDTYRTSVAYTLERSRFSLFTTAISTVFVLSIVLSGVLGTIDAFIAGWGFHPYLHGLLTVLAVTLVFRLFSLPFSIWSQFVIEAKFGFNKMTPKTFAADQVKGLLVSGLLFVPLLLGLFLFMDVAGGFWWIWALVFVTLFQLVVTLLYPTVIAPIFNTFSPLPEGSLRDKIESLASRLGFRTRGIFVMDGSRRSRHSNAYFTGIGGAKRIVLYDTLISSLSEDEIVSVLAHEIGHEKKRHVLKRLALSIVVTGVGLFVIDLLLGWSALYAAFGFRSPSFHAILIILAFASSAFTFFLTPLFSIWSRRHEYEADRYAVDAVGTAEHMVNALLGLGRDNLSNLTPHPLYSFYHYSHPTLAERIRAMESYARSGT